MTDQKENGAHQGCVDPQDLLLILADTLDDLERIRVALSNRLRALTSPEQVGEKGGSFGKGLPSDHPVASRLAGLLDAVGVLEHQAELELNRAVRQHHLGPWVKRTVGAGEKQTARLLAAIGDPGERRTVSQLWAYCGLHVLHPGQFESATQTRCAGVDPSSDTGHSAYEAHPTAAGVAPRRQRGQKANWSNTAKMRVRLIAVSCIKQAHSPYRAVYDRRRAHTTATHPEWTPLHSHNDGLRIVAKEVLKDLWCESRQTTVVTTPIHAPSGGTELSTTLSALKANFNAEGGPVIRVYLETAS